MNDRASDEAVEQADAWAWVLNENACEGVTVMLGETGLRRATEGMASMDLVTVTDACEEVAPYALVTVRLIVKGEPGVMAAEGMVIEERLDVEPSDANRPLGAIH